MSDRATSLVAAASFEERSLVTTRQFLDDGGAAKDVHLASVMEQNIENGNNVASFAELGVESIEAIDRLSSEKLWRWVWRTVDGLPEGDIVVDITCFPRELLGMMLFAMSLTRQKWERVTVKYVGAPEQGYATQNPALSEDERWLSKGVHEIRSVIGFPGEFSGERASHLVALAGHEKERLMEIVKYIEPRRLTIGGGQEGSSTAKGAGEYSRNVVDGLRSQMPLPDVGDVAFKADSVHDVYRTLVELDIACDRENVWIAAMNTKLAFVGAALFALRERRVRMMYAVPSRYNPRYCEGVGREYCTEIGDLLGEARTEAM